MLNKVIRSMNLTNEHATIKIVLRLK